MRCRLSGTRRREGGCGHEVRLAAGIDRYRAVSGFRLAGLLVCLLVSRVLRTVRVDSQALYRSSVFAPDTVFDVGFRHGKPYPRAESAWTPVHGHPKTLSYLWTDIFQVDISSGILTRSHIESPFRSLFSDT